MEEVTLSHTVRGGLPKAIHQIGVLQSSLISPASQHLEMCQIHVLIRNKQSISYSEPQRISERKMSQDLVISVFQSSSSYLEQHCSLFLGMTSIEHGLRQEVFPLCFLFLLTRTLQEDNLLYSDPRRCRCTYPSTACSTSNRSGQQPRFQFFKKFCISNMVPLT